MHYRQGDVLLDRVEALPADAYPIARDEERLVIAHGEATGHAHVVEGDAELWGDRFLQVEREARLVHEEHAAITLPPGVYFIRHQREYEPTGTFTVAD